MHIVSRLPLSFSHVYLPSELSCIKIRSQKLVILFIHMYSDHNKKDLLCYITMVINLLRKTCGKSTNYCGAIAHIDVHPFLPCSIHLLQEFVRLSTGLYIRPSMVFIHPLAFPCIHSSSKEGFVRYCSCL